ncbi:hypothetical protein [Luteipulveratus halotolerans]|uniref:N-acetyltransferase domain-containing protein n=1 Tax=Luteipulveratus halotolerans TaxID=1631356 RepID=A0A0L6CH37_9MICO|nr:hypothetical protein [Luteipulveratus halotolerans]KNX37117.1 hypothetical protein VV01_08105 [Luteipulveratus halotolerans]
MLVDLADVLRDAAAGRFPAVDGGWERARTWHPHVEAVVAFTGHAYLAVRDDLVTQLPVDRLDGFGGAHDPRVVAALARGGWIDSLDALLVHPGQARARGGLVERPDLGHHPRAQLARRMRRDVRVLGRADPRSTDLVTMSTGIAGLTELGVETGGGTRSGRSLIEAALASVNGPVVAAVAPGNARALRAFLATGFVPVGSVQLFGRDEGSGAPADG